MANISKAEYEELIRKKPSLRPTEVRNISDKGVSPWASIIENPPSTWNVTIKQETPVKSPRTLVFTILGQPVGKPRQTRSDVWKKRPCVMRYRAWADKARASVPPGVSLGVYRQISFIAYLEFPKSYSTTKRAWLTGQPHLQKPDVDNLLKSFDALFPEDKFIWKVSGEKRWQDGGGARIEVELR